MTERTIPTVTLNNGVTMPQLGLGVWQTKDGQEVETAVAAAIESGYRLIDTAAVYGNEAGVGRAIARSGVAREELFITTKLWNADQGYDKTLAAFNKSLSRLGLEYIDLYLIHWPMDSSERFIDTWRAFEKLYADKKVRAIGVSNFNPHHLDDLLSGTTVVPVINQIELHPRLPQIELREYGKQHGIQIEAWSPIGGSGGNLLQEPALVAIGEKYGKSAAQVVIRWHIQNGVVVIPKSVHADRIAQNIDVFDFELNNDDMAVIDGMDTGERTGPDPEKANFT